MPYKESNKQTDPKPPQTSHRENQDWFGIYMNYLKILVCPTGFEPVTY